MKKTAWFGFYALLLVLTGLFMPVPGEASSSKVANKLLHMYRLYYLPFSISFREGSTPNEVVPLVDADDSGLSKRLLKAPELQSINDYWDRKREENKKSSLFLTTNVGLNKSIQISRSLLTHKISLSRKAFDGISLEDRIKLTEALKSKPTEVQKLFKQLRFLKSFIPARNRDNFNFFIVSASWCQSCLEYRSLLETYIKKFPNAKLALHSVVIDDPNEKIFDSLLLKELFPNPKKYSHESIPRFLALEQKNGKPVLYEEGNALKVLYDRYLAQNRGFLDQKTKVFQNLKAPKRGLSSAKR